MRAVLELAFTLASEVLSEVAIVRAARDRVAAFAAPTSPRSRIGAFALGTGFGAAFTLIARQQLFDGVPFTGISIALSPLAAAIVMHYLGLWRHARGHPTTVLVTPVGAAVFAFGFAVARTVGLYLMVGNAGA